MTKPIGYIARVHVRPSPSCSALSPGAKGAYANIASLASNSIAAEDAIRSEMAELGLQIIDFENIEPIADMYADDRVDPEMNELVGNLSEEYPVQYYTFFNYYNDDA